MTAICEGSIAKYDNLPAFRDEITDLIERSEQKVNNMNIRLSHSSPFLSYVTCIAHFCMEDATHWKSVNCGPVVN